MKKENLHFLFGAGASYGAGSILPEKPPLGFQLFNELKKLYKSTWGSLPNEINILFEQNFEFGMKEIWKLHSHSIAPLMQNMSEYFIAFRPVNNSSLYCKLIKELISKNKIQNTSFSSLNYDIILEQSLIVNNRVIDYFNNQTSTNKNEVLKIHGSSNYFAHGITAGKGVSYGSGAIFNSGIQASFDTNLILQQNLVSSGLAPVMSLYMEGKPINIAPNAIKEIVKRFKFKIEESNKIFIIGIKPIPEDNHIWNCFEDFKGTLFYIGNKNDFKEFSRLKIKAIHLGEYFNNSFNKLIKKI
jgi:hypothetical protein